MNLTELSISRAGRSSTRTEGACLGSSLKIARRGRYGWGTTQQIDSLTLRRCGDAPQIDSLTFRRCGDAPQNDFLMLRRCGDAPQIDSFTPGLCGGAPQDDFSRHLSNTNPMLNENRNLGLWNTMG